MNEILLVSIGGFFGAISRFIFSKQIQNRVKTSFPLGTLIVNLIGAFIFGLLMGMQIKGSLNALLGIGFIGAFTTFSTLKLESEQLRKAKKYKLYYGYLSCTYLLGIFFAICGIIIGKSI